MPAPLLQLGLMEEAQEEINQKYRDYHQVFGDTAGQRVLVDLVRFASLLELDDPVDWAHAQGKQDVLRFIFDRMGYADDIGAAVHGLLSTRPGVPMLPEIEREE